jgi:glycosyltransferase involved in cell wall biosynthesis
MAQGLPILALDHQGVGTFVPVEAGIKVPVTNPRETTHALAAAIEKLAKSPALVCGMQLAGWTFAKEQTWNRRAEKMSKIYEEVAAHRKGRPGMNKSLISPVGAEL